MAVRTKAHHRRVERIRQAFRYKDTLTHADLPWGVGAGTMGTLVKEGIVEVVDPSIPSGSKNYAWRLAKTVH